MGCGASTARQWKAVIVVEAEKKVAELLSSGKLKLLCVTWLLAQPDDYVLRRCQDLPAKAFLSGTKAAKVWMKEQGLAVVSYGWLTREHPDPNGHHMRRVRKALKRLSAFQGLFDSIGGVFWDFAALPQRGVDGTDKTEEENLVFREGLGALTFLYGSPRTVVLQSTAMPADIMAPPGSLENKTAYKDRGWCCFEATVSAILKASKLLLNIGEAETMLFDDNTDTKTVLKKCTSTRLPPATPEDLKNILQHMHFTSGADRGMVVDKYTEFFKDAAKTATVLVFNNQADSAGWGDPEVQQLCRALPAFTACKVLGLAGHSITGKGLQLIAEALPKMSSLEKLYLAWRSCTDRSTFDGKAWEHLHQQLEASSGLFRWCP